MLPGAQPNAARRSSKLRCVAPIPPGRLPIFSRHCYRLDMLHVFDHHGVASHVVGNIFAMPITAHSAVIPGATQELRMQFLNGDIKGLYSMQRVESRMPALKMSSIYRAGFP